MTEELPNKIKQMNKDSLSQFIGRTLNKEELDEFLRVSTVRIMEMMDYYKSEKTPSNTEVQSPEAVVGAQEQPQAQQVQQVQQEVEPKDKGQQLPGFSQTPSVTATQLNNAPSVVSSNEQNPAAAVVSPSPSQPVSSEGKSAATEPRLS